MGARMRNARRTPLVALVSAILSPLLLTPASASVSHVMSCETSSVHRVFAGSGTIQAAIDCAMDGDLILIGPGVYRERLNLRGKTLCLRGSEGANKTLIDGSPLSPEGPRGSTITMRSGEGAQTRLEGLSIAGGDGTGTKRGRTQGGGLYLKGTSPVIEDCLILNNSAWQGGAVYLEDGSPHFINCWFYLNDSRGGGSTIDCVRSSPMITACGFHEDGIQWKDAALVNIGPGCGIVGACCVGDACIMAGETACHAAGGAWKEHQSCNQADCPMACTGDVNGDHRVNMTDMLLLLAHWGMCG